MNFPRRCADFSNIYLFLFLLSPQASKSGISSWVRQFLIKYAAKKENCGYNCGFGHINGGNC